MGQLTPKIHWTKTNMQRFALLVIASVAAASPIEDTADVAAAKAEFNAAFTRAEAGRHIELAPMNNDVQAAPIASAYLADSDDVAAAKAEFKAAFENVAAGGLADMQEPAPVHKLPAVPAAVHPYMYGLYHPYTYTAGAYYPYTTYTQHVAAPAPYTLPYGGFALPYHYPVVPAPVKEAAVKAE